MCGIVGVYQPENARRRFAVEDVHRMADAIVHRGPDDHGFHEDRELMFGMRRLSIIDIEGGHQPIANKDRTIWVVNNGEIYNYKSLRKQLLERGYTFRSGSDTEVLVHLYEEYGESFVQHLDGMFAVAIWDSCKRKLLLARDRMGIKPVYYWRSGANLAFASEIKSFLGLPGFTAAVNSGALSDYLGIGYAVAPATIFDGVMKLPPGSLLICQDGTVQVSRYWSPPTETDSTIAYEEWVDRVRDGLDRAVQEHMISDVPIGAFLSGGIDSSAIVALMAKRTNQPLNTYSIGYRGSQVADYYNELSYAKTVADQMGSSHREIEVEPNVAALLPKLMWHLEEPISDSAITTTYLVSELAADSVKVILSGVGGDELFAGYNRYLGDHYSRRYEKLPRWCRQGVLPKLAQMLPSGRQNRLMDISRYAKRFIQAGQMHSQDRYAFYLSIADAETLDSLIENGGMDCGGQNGLLRAARSEESEDELLRLFRIDWQTQLAENLLLLTDKMTMACSIECRVPFLDHKLVELAAQIPAQHKLPGGRLKGLLKDSLLDILPESVINRRKRGFGAPVGAWFKRELSSLRAELLGRQVLDHRGLLNPDVVERVCVEHDSNRADFTDLILVMMNIEIWSRLFLDGRSHDDVSAELIEKSFAA